MRLTFLRGSWIPCRDRVPRLSGSQSPPRSSYTHHRKSTKLIEQVFFLNYYRRWILNSQCDYSVPTLRTRSIITFTIINPLSLPRTTSISWHTRSQILSYETSNIRFFSLFFYSNQNTSTCCRHRLLELSLHMKKDFTHMYIYTNWNLM